jgi:hypothetical protein
MTEDDKNFEFVEVTGPQRFTFNAKYFGNPIFDIKVFNIADQCMIGYEGGLWKYMLFKDVPFYVLEGCDVITLRNPFSGEEFQMDAHLAGMIMVLYAFQLQLEIKPTEKLCNTFQHLKDLIYDYAEEIGQFQQAFGMID